MSLQRFVSWGSLKGWTSLQNGNPFLKDINICPPPPRIMLDRISSYSQPSCRGRQEVFRRRQVPAQLHALGKENARWSSPSLLLHYQPQLTVSMVPTSCLVPRCAGWRLWERTGFSSATPEISITETGCMHEFFCILPARFQTCWACIQTRAFASHSAHLPRGTGCSSRGQGFKAESSHRAGSLK